VVGFTIGSRREILGKGKTCDKRRNNNNINNNNNNNNSNNDYVLPIR
jgi:hypothetical protein